MKRYIWIILLPLIVLTACSEKATPIVVYVTATPAPPTVVSGILPVVTESATPEAVLASNEPAFAENMPSAESTQVSIAQASTATLTITPTLTPTRRRTRLPTVTPTPARPRRTKIPTPTPTRRPRTKTPTPGPTHTPAPIPNIPLPEALPILNPEKFGIQLHPFVTREEWTATLHQVDDIGAFGWLKIQLDWSQLEPQRGQYSDLFYAYVQRVQWANFEGARPYRVLLSVVKAPDWARPAGADLTLDGPPADPNELARFITDFVRETKPEDNRIGAIEIWNEPNLEREWGGMTISGQTYMQYFVPSYNAIKAIAPNIVVITAGLAPVGDVTGAVSDRRFLQQMYDAGLAQYPEARVGVHPYGWGNAPDERCCVTDRGWADNPVFYFAHTLDDYAQIMAKNNHTTRLWITEFGWGTYKGIGQGGGDVPAPPAAPQFDLVTAQEQAEFTIRAMELLQTAPYDTQVEIAILWNLNFATLTNAVQDGQEQAGYSLLDASGAPRLLYLYLKQTRKVQPQ